MLSKKRITRALIRLCGYAGWSAPLLFANLRKQEFSRGGAKKYKLKTQNEYLNKRKVFSIASYIAMVTNKVTVERIFIFTRTNEPVAFIGSFVTHI